MSIFVSGACARIFYSSEAQAYPTRLSVDFARNLKHSSYVSASGLVIPLSVTVGCPTGAFTAVLDALVDPLCEEDVVLGKDWVTSCTLNNVLPQLDLLPVYSSCECLVIYIIWLLFFVVVIIALSVFFYRIFICSFRFVVFFFSLFIHTQFIVLYFFFLGSASSLHFICIV